MRKLHSLISLLLVLLMLAPCALADAPLLQAASDWDLADTPLSVTLSISLQAHAPFDETRTAMLDRVLAPLSLNLYASDGESGVSVLMNGNELLTMAQKGDAVQFSCMPNVSYASLDGNALELLLGTTSDSLDLRAVDGTFEKWIDDGWVLSNAILEPFAEYGKRKRASRRPSRTWGWRAPARIIPSPSRSWRKCSRRFCPSARKAICMT